MDPIVRKEPGVRVGAHLRDLHGHLRREVAAAWIIFGALLATAAALITLLVAADNPGLVPARRSYASAPPITIVRLLDGRESVSFQIESKGAPFAVSLDAPLVPGTRPASHGGNCPNGATACMTLSGESTRGSLPNVRTGSHVLYAALIVNGRVIAPVVSRAMVSDDLEGTWAAEGAPPAIQVGSRAGGSVLERCGSPASGRAGTNTNISRVPLRYEWGDGSSAAVTGPDTIEFLAPGASSPSTLTRAALRKACE